MRYFLPILLMVWPYLPLPICYVSGEELRNNMFMAYVLAGMVVGFICGFVVIYQRVYDNFLKMCYKNPAGCELPDFCIYRFRTFSTTSTPARMQSGQEQRILPVSMPFNSLQIVPPVNSLNSLTSSLDN